MSDDGIFGAVEDDDLDSYLGGATATLDLNAANIPDDTYLTNVKRVELQVVEPTGDKNGKFQVIVNAQLDTADYPTQRPWNGQYHTDYIYLGKSPAEVTPLGLKRLSNFIESITGQLPEDGQLDWRAYGYYKDAEGRRCLSSFEGLPVGQQLVRETGNDGVERLKTKAYKPAANLRPTTDEFGEKPF